MRKLFTFSLSLYGALLFGQYSTPGTGQTYTISALDELTDVITYDVTTQQYILTENLTISATDTFLSTTGYTLAIAENKLITVEGAIRVDSPETVHFTSTNPGTIYFYGLRLNDGSTAYFNHFKMTNGGGIRALDGDFYMTNSEVSYQNAGISTGAAINFSEGNPTIEHSIFKFNDTPAVASGANQSVALNYFNNYLEANNQANSNRPQINMGPSGSAGITHIKHSTILGDRTKTKVGAISVSSLLGVPNHVIIEENTLKDNRYGITISGGNSKGSIVGNIIEDNDTETIPANGGSGINIYLASNSPENVIDIQNNLIKGNLWGITNVGNGAFIRLSNDEGMGNNTFENNGNGGVNYALYNNSPNPIDAKGNCWDPILTDERVEEVIVHYHDDVTLGLVDYSDYVCLLSTNDVAKQETIKIYPNPSLGNFTVDSTSSSPYLIVDATGKVIKRGVLQEGKNTIQTSLPKGIYIFKTDQSSSKVVIK